jgi:hypothetical protein
MDGFTIKRLLRRPWLSLLGLAISALLCLLLCILAGTLRAERQRLEDVRESYEILCIVSDVRGTKTDWLGMTHIYTDFLTDTETGIGAYVKDLRLSKSFSYRFPGSAGSLIGVSSPRATPLLDEAMGGNYACEAEDFFESRDYICLVPKEIYDLYAGRSLTFILRDPAGASRENPSGLEAERDFRVVGWYLGGNGEIFMPYPASQVLAAQLAPSATTDSASFLLADNSKVQELTEAAQPMLSPVDPGAEAPKGLYALTIHDEQYKATVSAMEQNIRRLELLLPGLALLSLGAGFLLGFLATRGEARTYALMRTLGLTRRRLFALVMAEQLVLPALAALVIAAALRRPGPAGLFLLCHAVGCALAVLRSVRVAPSAILREQE